MFKRTLDLGITLSAVTTLPQSGGLSIGRMLGRSFSGSGRQFEGCSHTALYARYRPRPPPSLVRSILRLLDGGPATSLALDVGCGSGKQKQISLSFKCGRFSRWATEKSISTGRHAISYDIIIYLINF